MITEDRLIGWLCFMRFNIGSVGNYFIPTQVKIELAAKGWIEIENEIRYESGEGEWLCKVTDAGHSISDLAAPEWGIDPCPPVEVEFD